MPKNTRTKQVIRSISLRVTVALAFIAASSAAGGPPATTQYRVYEISDLLPPGAATSPPAELAASIGANLGVRVVSFSSGLIAVQAEQAKQEAFAQTLEKMRSVYTERVGVRIAVYEVDADQSLRAGSAASSADWGSPIYENARFVYRGLPTTLEALTNKSYTARIDVTVGTGGMGFEPEVESLELGLRARVRVEKENAERSLVSLTGEITHAAIRSVTFSGHIAGAESRLAGESKGTFELPEFTIRSFASDIPLTYERETVFAVIKTPDSELHQVVTAVIEKPSCTA